MRIKRPLAVRKWRPMFRAMGPMLEELYRHPEKGFLGGESSSTAGSRPDPVPALLRGPERFARDPEDSHMPAWQRFNREARSSGAVGIWHEIYIVGHGNYEAIYANMPEFGLAKATERVPAIGGRETARRRLMRSENDTETGPSSE
jgi:hypothetical protein